MLFCCEICGKKFNNEKEALLCEKKHEEAKKEKERLAAERNSRMEEILKAQEELNVLTKKFNKDYGAEDTEDFEIDLPRFVFDFLSM